MLLTSFNPRTHTGCDGRENVVCGVLRVSIHAPIQGATCFCCSVTHSTVVSIHAPIQGATIGSQSSAMSELRFNPRTHTGCDSTVIGIKIFLWVSIHAPIQGATLFLLCVLLEEFCFNPRTHTGCDYLLSLSVEHELSFNPRTHTGCDILSR